MMQIRTTAALVVGLSAIVAGQVALNVSPPTTLATIEIDKAQPYRFAWSPDGSQLYLQTLQGTFDEAAQRSPKAKFKHYVFSAADGSKKDVSSEPDWAAQYWAAKSGQGSPDSASFKIDVKESTEVRKAGSVPMGGDMARGGVEGGGERGGGSGGTSAGDAALAAAQTQQVRVLTMTLNREAIGRFENSVMVPGLTYGWGPKGTNAIAFTTDKGRIVLMDTKGAKKELEGTKDAVIPAWSPDGKKLAWLQKDGKKKYLVQIATVSGS